MKKTFIFIILTFILKSEGKKHETDSVEDIRETIVNNEKNIQDLQKNISRLETNIQKFLLNTTTEKITENITEDVSENITEEVTEIFTKSSEKTNTESFENITENFVDLDSLNTTDISPYKDILDKFNISHYLKPTKNNLNFEQTTEQSTDNSTEIIADLSTKFERSTEKIKIIPTEKPKENIKQILFKIFIIMFALTASPIGVMAIILAVMKIREFLSKRSYNLSDIPLNIFK